MARPMWVRVSGRGRYHDVVGTLPTGAVQTRCGRVLTESMVTTRATGAAPGRLCERCQKPVDKRRP